MNWANNFLCYIDPGTGSMLFTIIIGVATTAVFLIRGLFIKMKYKGRGRQQDDARVPYVFFSDSKNYWTTFKPVCDEFEKRGIDAEYWTMSEDDPALSAEYGHITARYLGTANVAFSKLNTMKADMCLATTPGLDVLQWKRSKGVGWYSFIFHDISDGLGYRMFALDYYDAVLGTGGIQESVVRKLEELRHLPAKEVKTVGCVYVDGLLEKAEKASIREPSEKTVLLAPSWGPSSILNRFGKYFIEALIDTGYRIVVRPHPQSKVSEKEMLDSLMAQFPENDRFSWNFDRDNFECLAESGILISDFSSVMFDYAFVFNKPFIYTDTGFDKNPYDAVWVEEEPWHFRALPQLGYCLKEEDIPDMKNVIDRVMESDTYREGRSKCISEGWAFRGQAAEKITDYLVDKHRELFEEGK